MTAQRASLIGVIGDNDLPPPPGEWLAVVQERERAIEFPVGFEVVTYLLLERRKHGLHLRVGQASGGIGDGNDRKRHGTPAVGYWLLAVGNWFATQA